MSDLVDLGLDRCQGWSYTVDGLNELVVKTPHDRRLQMSKSLLSFSLLAVIGMGATVARAEAPARSIVAIASEAGTFKTLVAALGAADLVGALEGPGPFTVFAPTDEAFAKLPAGTVESLLLPENKAKLQAILQYHVVSGRVLAAQARTVTSAKTLQGSAVPIATAAGGLTVGGAKVVTADIQASNGVIHVIDSVILPPAN
jgi:uncharacterized surface protein with fasciclin (FAS1) repeats